MSGRDLVVAAVLIFGFAAFVTVHVWLAMRLALRGKPRIRGFIALVVPPLAPLWGYRQGFRRGAALWIASLVTYVLALLAAQL